MSAFSVRAEAIYDGQTKLTVWIGCMARQPGQDTHYRWVPACEAPFDTAVEALDAVEVAMRYSDPYVIIPGTIELLETV